MIKKLKYLIPTNVKRYYWRYLKLKKKSKKNRIKFDGKNPEETFTFIYETNYWSGRDSISGGGSDLIHTQIVIKSIEELIDELKFKSILDIPCGDFVWMQYVSMNNAKYIGGDIVYELINENTLKFGSRENVDFKVINLLSDILPKSDIIINRDCLVHLSYSDIYKALQNIKKSGCKYLLTTTFPNQIVNQDITTGEWRTLNLEIAPFNFDPPIKLISEQYNNSKHLDKSLALWEIKDVKLADLLYCL